MFLVFPEYIRILFLRIVFRCCQACPGHQYMPCLLRSVIFRSSRLRSLLFLWFLKYCCLCLFCPGHLCPTILPLQGICLYRHHLLSRSHRLLLQGVLPLMQEVLFHLFPSNLPAFVWMMEKNQSLLSLIH